MLEQSAGPEVEIVGTEVKPTTATASELLARVDAAGEELRALIVAIKTLPREKNAIQTFTDPSRSLSIAQVELQTGLMWLRKAIEPKGF